VRTWRAAWLVILAAGGVAGGCGYSSQSLHRTDVRTIAVPIFASKEFRREVEFEVSKALVKMIEDRTPYQVVHSPERADTELRGEILELTSPVLSENVDTDSPQDVQVTISCWFEWKDLRTGKVLVRREYVGASATYAVAVGQTLDSATTEAARRLAERIVEYMESDF